MTLYEINEKLLECVDAETGEIIDPELLTSLEMEFDNKVEGIALWIKNLTAEAKALKEEKDALYKRQKACENKAASLKNYLSGFLMGEKFKTSKCSITYRKSEQLVISPDANVPGAYLRYIAPEVDKKALKEAIKDGKQIEGCEIVENMNIQIR